jgi:hypothetical protein
MDVLGELIVKFIAFPLSELFVVAPLSLNEALESQSSLLDVLGASDRLPTSHGFDGLIVNCLGCLHLVLVVRGEASDFLDELLNLSNGPLALDGLVFIDDFLKFLISIVNIGARRLVAAFVGVGTVALFAGLLLLGEERTSLGASYLGVWSLLEGTLFARVFTCRWGFGIVGGCCGEKPAWSGN